MRILLILSQYRVCERILPTITVLKEEFDLDCLLVYQMKSNHRWPGNEDLRTSFFKEYSSYFSTITEDINLLDYNNYDLIISDDNRDTPKTNLRHIYQKKNCIMVGCYHGAGEKWNNFEFIESVYGKVLDRCFVMGKSDVTSNISIPIGVPSNDILQNYQSVDKKHILVIINFLGNRSCPFSVKVNDKFIEEVDFSYIQNKFDNLVIIFKLKSRADEGKNGFLNNKKYLYSLLKNQKIKYKIVCDIKDLDGLIANSEFVLSAPSTLAYKSIQLGIPTVLIKDSGQLGNFGEFKGLVEFDKEKIKNKIDEMVENPKDINFINNYIEGGLDFNSTKVFLDRIRELI